MSNTSRILLKCSRHVDVERLCMLDFWRHRARELKRDAFALYLACKDPRTPWYAKFLAALVVGYAFSPIDLIPDFIPVLGQLDDLILVPLGILLVRRLISTDVMNDCRHRAEEEISDGSPVIRVAAAVIILLWILCVATGYMAIQSWMSLP